MLVLVLVAAVVSLPGWRAKTSGDAAPLVRQLEVQPGHLSQVQAAVREGRREAVPERSANSIRLHTGIAGSTEHLRL